MALATAATATVAVSLLAGSAAAAGAAPAVGTAGAVGAAPASPQARWPSHLVLAEPARLAIGNQVIDSATGADFALASANAGATSKLRRTVLSSGRVKLGPAFPVSSIGLGGGYVWVYGVQELAHNTLKFRLYQVSPSTLAVVRSSTLASARNAAGFMGLTPDGSGDIAVGYLRSVRIINARSGATAGTITIRRGLFVSDVSARGRYLYVAANGPGGGSVVLEYNARTLRLLASNSRRPLLFSVGGALLTSAPGGVWVSFRTGMLGQTVLLRQHGLGFVTLPGSGTRGDLFVWVMTATTEFAGASVFLAKEGGQVGCMNPATGHIRARGSVPGLSETGELIGAATDGRVLYGVSPRGVIAISPPSACG
jgi:hypothetical protein